MRDSGEPPDEAAVAKNRETATVRWATQEEAGALISQSTGVGGRERDLRTLEAAFRELGGITRGRDRS